MADSCSLSNPTSQLSPDNPRDDWDETQRTATPVLFRPKVWIRVRCPACT